MTEILKKGDKIWLRGPFGTKHYGLYIGRCGSVDHAVVHNSKVQGGVVIDPFERFACGSQVIIESRAAPGFEQVVVDRALALCGTKYDLLGFNCEHMVNVAQTGEHKSQQLRNAAGGVTALYLGVNFFRYLANRPTYDHVVDRYRDKRGRFVSG